MNSILVAMNQQVDYRINQTSHMLQDLKSIKASGLTGVVVDYIQAMLVSENSLVEKARLLLTWVYGCGAIGEALPTLVVSYGIFWSLKSPDLSIADSFVTLSVISILCEPFIYGTAAWHQISKALIWFHQIQEFLLLDEIPDMRQAPIPASQANGSSEHAGPVQESTEPLYYRDVRIVETSTTPIAGGRQVLIDVNLYFQPYKLSVIIGDVGSGKSTLIKLITGQMRTMEGHIFVDKAGISYCGQIPWIRNRSLRENIVGRQEFMPGWYRIILHVCHLLEDFAQMQRGDMTIAGSGGCNLSGGQKHRVVSNIYTPTASNQLLTIRNRH